MTNENGKPRRTQAATDNGSDRNGFGNAVHSSTLTGTGIGFLDDLITGFEAGRIYSLLGASGSAKTTLAVQVAVQYAKCMQSVYRQNEDVPIGKVYYVTTEDGITNIRHRMLSCASRVDRDIISGVKDVPLTTRETLSRNDRDLQDVTGVLLSETERLDMAIESLSSNVRVIDISDKDSIPPTVHPTTFILSRIKHVLSTAPHSRCGLIIIDHCETLINRVFTSAPPGTNRYEPADQLPGAIKDNLAAVLDCPVFVVHQASGHANEKEEWDSISHTDAKGTKSWGTCFDACLSITKIDRRNSTCKIRITKNRYGDIPLEPTTLKLRGNICALELAGEEDLMVEPEKRSRKTFKRKPKQVLVFPD